MTDVALIIKIDSSDVGKATIALEQLAKEGVQAEATTKSLATATSSMAAAVKGAAAAFGAYKLMGLIKESAMLNARFETMGIVMVEVGKNAGYSASEMTSFEMALRKTGISMIESRENITKMAQAQLDLTKTEKLARVAQDAAVIGNLNSSEAFARVVHGIQSGQTETLRTIGINVDFQKGYEKLSKELGVTEKNLTETQKAQARMNEVMEYGTRIAGTYENAMGTAGKQLQSMKRYVEDLKVKFGETFNDALTIAVFGFSDALKDANKEADKLANDGSLKAWGQDVVYVLASIADGFAAVAGAIVLVGQGIAIRAEQAKALFKPGGIKEFKELGAMQTKAAADYEAGLGRFTRSADKFYAGKEEQRNKERSKEHRYLSDLLIVQKAFANESLAVQQAAMEKLAEFHFPEVPTVPRGGLAAGGNTDASGKDAAAEKIKDTIEALKFEAEQLKRSATEQEIYNQLKSAGVTANSKAGKQIAELVEHLTREKAAAAGLDKEFDAVVASQEAMVAQYDADVARHLTDYVAKLDAEVVALDEAQRAQNKYNKTLDGMVDSLKDELELVGMTAREKRVLQEHRKIDAMLEEQILDIKKRLLPVEKELQLIEKARADASAAKNSAAATIVAIEDTSAALTEQVNFWKSIDQTAHDTFVSILDGSKDFATRLRDTLKNVLFDWLYQMTVKKWLINLSATVSGTGVAQQAFGATGGSAVSGFSSGVSMLGAAGNVASYAGAAGLFGSAAAGGVPVTSTIGSVLSGAGYVGAGSTGLMGTVGAALASVPVWGWAALAALAVFGLGKKEPSDKSGWAEVDLATGESLGTGGMTGKKFSQENRDAAKSATEVGSAYAQMLIALGAEISGSLNIEIGNRDGLKADINNDNVWDIIEKDQNVFFDKLFDALTKSATGLDESLKTLLISFDGTTEQMFEFTSALVAIRDYTTSDVMADALDQIEKAGRSTWQTWQSGNDELRTMAANFDGSLSSATELSNATIKQYQLELNLIGQIQGLLISTSAMFGDSIEQITLATMDASQQYDYWRTELDKDYAALMAATDPAEIARLSGEINQDTMNAYGLLEGDQKSALAPEFIQYLEGADALTTERLNAAQDAIVSTHKDLATAIETVMTKVAEQMMAAADTQMVAAQTPVEVNVHVVGPRYAGGYSYETDGG